jgi:lipopolysaccharide transport system permease protein
LGVAVNGFFAVMARPEKIEAMKMNKWSPALAVSALWQHRVVAWQFSRRYVQMGFRGSVLGGAWIVLSPLLLLGLYFFVFGSVFGGSFQYSDANGAIQEATGVDYALGIFLGLSVLNLFSGILAGSPGLVVGNPNFVKKVVFPLEVLPVALVGQLGFNFCVNFSLCLLGVVFIGPGAGWAWMWLPMVLVPLLLMVLGLAWFLSAVGVYLRDTGQLAPFLGMVLLYSSAVFYSVSMIPADFWLFLKWNPVLHGVNQLRGVLLWGLEPSWKPLAYVWATGISGFLAGNWVFERLRNDFADLL